MMATHVGGRFKIGDRVRLRSPGRLLARVIELRGPLGQNRALVYGLRLGHKRGIYTERAENELEPAPYKRGAGDPPSGYRLSLGDRVRITTPVKMVGRVVGFLGKPETSPVYRLRVGPKANRIFVEVREDQLDSRNLREMTPVAAQV